MSTAARIPFSAFRSRNLGELRRPVFPADMAGPAGTFRASFLLDSGADVSLIPYSSGRQIGLSPSSARPLACGGIGDGLIAYHLCPVTTQIEGIRLRIRVGWCTTEIPYYILGRLDVFDLLDIEFRQSANCILLRPAAATPA